MNYFVYNLRGLVGAVKRVRQAYASTMGDPTTAQQRNSAFILS